MHDHHNSILVSLSILIAILASYAALDLVNSVSVSKGRARWLWMTGGSLAMGVGIWSMHFIGMLAFSIPGLVIAYDLPLLILSIVVAVVASAFTLYIVSREKPSLASYTIGSLSMGGAIAGMHYIGIWSMRMAAVVYWNEILVGLSIVVAVAASFIALLFAFKFRKDTSMSGFVNRGLASIIMGVAISGMHYTGMAAMTIVQAGITNFNQDNLLATDGLAIAVIIGTIIILGIALMGSNIDRSLSRRIVITEALEEAVKTRDEFFSVASHELKTPLTSIKLQTQLIIKVLTSEKPDLDKAIRFLKQTDTNVERITRLVDDMLEITRLSQGKLSLHKETFDISQTVSEIVERHEPLLKTSGCDLSLQNTPNLVGEWDKFRIEQVLTNLLTNASRYGAGTPVIVKVQKLDEKVQISVKDFGSGIAPEDQKRIFNRFERAASKHETRALGLGLFIVKEIVEMHKGTIEVVSAINEGSEFIITLPIT